MFFCKSIEGGVGVWYLKKVAHFFYNKSMKDGKHTYKTHGTCAQEISFISKDDVITNIEFFGGCNGNLKMIAKLVDGMNAKEIAQKCSGNTCGFKSTSCADQLAKAMTAFE